jgi:hypothetical protein
VRDASVKAGCWQVRCHPKASGGESLKFLSLQATRISEPDVQHVEEHDRWRRNQLLNLHFKCVEFCLSHWHAGMETRTIQYH